MSEPKIVEERPTQAPQSTNPPSADTQPAAPAQSADGALTAGRAEFESAMAKGDPARRPGLEKAAVHFQVAITLNPGALEAYGWLSQTYRMLASAMRANQPDLADLFTRFACACAWEGSTRASSPAATPIRVKQEVRTLIAWLRATRHVAATDAEAEMANLRDQCLEAALGSPPDEAA
jgi:hypothetical protein